jgi:hypothetical protein
MRGLSPNLYIPRIGPLIWLQKNRQTDEEEELFAKNEL